jgi:hypothetical protein
MKDFLTCVFIAGLIVVVWRIIKISFIIEKAVLKEINKEDSDGTGT